jgi:adenylate kinase
MLQDVLEACPLSTGDVFRAAKDQHEDDRSPAMRDAFEHMKHGDLVPDELVVQMVRERLMCLHCRYGFLLDGFPRTVAQAEALDRMLADEHIQLDAVLQYEVSLQETVSRLSGRRSCAQCKVTFHIVNKPPKVDGICDHCGGKLFQREDDCPESIKVRLEEYQRVTAPLAAYYEREGLLISVPATGSPEDVFERTLKLLGDRVLNATANRVLM